MVSFDPNTTRDSRTDAQSSRLWRLSGMGSEMAFGVVGMALLGFLLDWWLKSSPWLVISCTALGLIGSVYNFIRRALAETRASAAQFKRDHPHGVTPPKRPKTAGRTRQRAGRAPDAQPPAPPLEPPSGDTRRGRGVPDGDDPYAG